MTASVRVAGDGGVPCPVAEYKLGRVVPVASSTTVPKRQPWSGPDWPQRSGYEIRAEAGRQTASAIRDVLQGTVSPADCAAGEGGE